MAVTLLTITVALTVILSKRPSQSVSRALFYNSLRPKSVRCQTLKRNDQHQNHFDSDVFVLNPRKLVPHPRQIKSSSNEWINHVEHKELLIVSMHNLAEPILSFQGHLFDQNILHSKRLILGCFPNSLIRCLLHIHHLFRRLYLLLEALAHEVSEHVCREVEVQEVTEDS